MKRYKTLRRQHRQERLRRSAASAAGRGIEAEVRREAADQRRQQRRRRNTADAEDSSDYDEEEDDDEVEDGEAAITISRPRLFINPSARENLDDDTMHNDAVLVERALNEDAIDFDVELPYNKLPVNSNYRQFFLKLHGLYEHKKEVLQHQEKRRFRQAVFSQRVRRIVYFASFSVLLVSNTFVFLTSITFLLSPFLERRLGDNWIVTFIFRYAALPFAFLALCLLFFIEIGVAISKLDKQEILKWTTTFLAFLLAVLSIVLFVVNFEILPSKPVQTLTNIYHANRDNVINMEQSIPWPVVFAPMMLGGVLMALLSAAQCLGGWNIRKTLLSRHDEDIAFVLINTLMVVAVVLFSLHLQFPMRMYSVFAFIPLMLAEILGLLTSLMRLSWFYSRYRFLNMSYQANEITALDGIAPTPKFHRDNKSIALFYMFMVCHCSLVILFTFTTFAFGVTNEPNLRFYVAIAQHGALLYGIVVALRNGSYHHFLQIRQGRGTHRSRPII